MKITHRGTIPEEVIWIGTCNNCKSIIEALAKELTITYHQIAGSSGHVCCLVCRKSVVFYEKE